MTDPNLTRLAAQAAALADASTLDELDTLYVEWVGYSIVQDDAAATVEGVRDTLTDYLRECCYAYGVHVGDIGLTS